MLPNFVRHVFAFALSCWWCCALAALAVAQSNTFTYQGRLTDATAPGTATYLMEFKLYDAPTVGTLMQTLSNQSVSVTNGVFSVALNFTAANAFNGNPRWLEICVKRNAGDAYTPLTPRQPLNSTPYAVRAATAGDALNVGGTPANQIIKEGDARLTDSRTPAAGSGNYIQNQNAAAQAAANFNIGGNGTANLFNAATQYNLGGQRVFSLGGTRNTLVGRNTGAGLTMGGQNAFFGDDAGMNNSTGSSNAFFGSRAGSANGAGTGNSFFGMEAGLSNSGGNFNAFFGANAGRNNQSGNSNVFFGVDAGTSNGEGSANAFFGRDAGHGNLSGGNNAFFGTNAGYNNTTGSGNVFLGVQTGAANAEGFNNTLVGTTANVSSGPALSYATALGAGAVVGANNTVVLGRGADTVQIPGSLNLTGTFTGNISVPAGNVTGVLSAAQIPNLDTSKITTGTFSAAQIPNLDAGKITTGTFSAARIPNLGTSYIANQTTAQTGNFNLTGDGTVGGTLTANSVTATTQYNLGSARILSAFGTDNTVVGIAAGLITTGTKNSFFGSGSGFFNLGGSFNSFFGVSSGFNNSSGSSNSFFGAGSGSVNSSGTGNSFFGSSAGGSNQGGSNNVFLGSSAGTANVSGSNNTIIGAGANFPGGATSLNYATVIGAGASSAESNTIVLGRNDASDTVRVPGKLKIQSFGTAGSTQLCYNASLEVAGCSSSLRYKTNLAPFSAGLALVHRLKPITFDWKEGGMHDLGLGAEEVAAIEPLLVTYNKAGQVEGVKYDRLGVVLLNAVKEQQAQIAAQQKQLAAQQAVMASLRRLVCRKQPRAAACQ